MSIEGRINIDCLFHDKDGTASLKVVSLQDSKAYTTGKVAIVSGTVGTTAVTFVTQDDGSPTSTYRDASGTLVSFSQIARVAVKATDSSRPLVFGDSSIPISIVIQGDQVLAYPCSVSSGDNVSVRSYSGTASYTIVMYGT
jgi:hypothetical protein